MAEHMPTDAEVRESFVDGAAGEFIGEDFDRWLTEVRREAWDEAVDTLSRHWEDFAPAAVADLERRNPYRKEQP